MKLKYYLRGLGIGIICTAVIMGIALSGGKKEKLTDDEIIERARLLGMVMEKEDQTEEEDSDKQKQEEPNSDGQKQEPQSGQQNPNGQNSQDAGTQGNEPENPDDAKAQGTGEGTGAEAGVPTDTGAVQPEIKNIEITAGEYSDVICGKLQEAGLITDAEAFNRHLTQIGADNKLQPGVYQIPAGTSEDEIVRILSKK